jgi:hypothetical protein
MAALWSVLALLGAPLLAVTTLHWSAATRRVYSACLAICLVVLAVAIAHLVSAGGAPSSLRLPLGLPWIGAHFRIDALTAFTAGAAYVNFLEADTGTIEPGKLADLVLVDGDPLTAITDLRKTRRVIKDGVVYDVDALTRGPARRSSSSIAP